MLLIDFYKVAETGDQVKGYHHLMRNGRSRSLLNVSSLLPFERVYQEVFFFFFFFFFFGKKTQSGFEKTRHR